MPAEIKSYDVECAADATNEAKNQALAQALQLEINPKKIITILPVREDGSNGWRVIYQD